jgi:hypothetical protein
MSDLEQKIREAAEKATPGEWRVCGASDGKCSCRLIWSVAADGVVAKAGCVEDAPEQEYEGFTVEQAALNQAYIALASPANILALLDEKDAERDEWKRIADRYRVLHFLAIGGECHTCSRCKAYDVLAGKGE